MEEKVYNVILVASGTERKQVEELRIRFTGSPLVDKHPPHVTLKGKFSLKENVSGRELLKKLEELSIAPIIFHADSLERWKDAIVLTGKSTILKERHRDLQDLLGPLVISHNSEWEGTSFTPHLNVVRDPGNKIHLTFKEIGIKNIYLDEILLNEYDPAPIKRFSKVIWRKKL